MYLKSLAGVSEEQNRFENLGIGSKIIIKWILKKHHSFASKLGQ
jgi:hypothetical protein